MKTYVITPVGPGSDPEHLRACCASVLSSTTPATHILIADGPEALDLDDLGTLEPYPEVLRLPERTNDIGSTPRTIGAAYAWGLGADFVAFLDSDCQFLPDHLTRLIQFQQNTGKPVVASGRYVTDWTDTHRERCPEIHPSAEPPFHDTNTFLFARTGIGVSYTYGTLTGDQHIQGDRIVSRRALPHLACHYHPTVLYRSAHRFHYRQFNWPIPDGLELKDLSQES